MPDHHRIQWWPSSKPVKDGPERFIRGQVAMKAHPVEHREGHRQHQPAALSTIRGDPSRCYGYNVAWMHAVVNSVTDSAQEILHSDSACATGGNGLNLTLCQMGDT